MVATSISFDLVPVSQFASLNEMIGAFDPQLTAKSKEKSAAAK
jgi:hypothetical protein